MKQLEDELKSRNDESQKIFEQDNLIEEIKEREDRDDEPEAETERPLKNPIDSTIMNSRD